jgi:hypothetical protein
LTLKLIPKSVNNVQKTYEVPEDKQANKNVSTMFVEILNRLERFINNATIYPT